MVIKKKLYLFIIMLFGPIGVHKLYSKGFKQGLSYVAIYSALLLAGGISVLIAMAEFFWVLVFMPSVGGYIRVS